MSLTAPVPQSVMYYNVAVSISNELHTIVLDFLIRVYPPIPNAPPSVAVNPPPDAFYCGVTNQLSIAFSDPNPNSILTIKLATPFTSSPPRTRIPPCHRQYNCQHKHHSQVVAPLLLLPHAQRKHRVFYRC